MTPARAPGRLKECLQKAVAASQLKHRSCPRSKAGSLPFDQGRSPNTVKAFLSDVRLLTQFLAPDQTVGSVTTRDLDRFFHWMEKERDVPCSPKTLARRITATKSFFRWLEKYGALPADPAEKVVQRSAVSPLPQVLTEDEVSLAMAAADITGGTRAGTHAPSRFYHCCFQPASRRVSAWESI